MLMASFTAWSLWPCLIFLFGGLMQAVQAMVQQAMQYIDQTPDLDTKIELIKTLNSVSAGKVIHMQNSIYLYFWGLWFLVYRSNCWQIYVEIERARLIKKLTKIKEEQGLIAEAADLMQEVAVSLSALMHLSYNRFLTTYLVLTDLCHRWKHLGPWQKLKK